MSLTVLGSLAVMLLLFSSLLHFVALVLPAWVQLGVFVPVYFTDDGGGEEGGGGLEAFGNATPASVDFAVDLKGPKMFVKIRLGLWEWCEQFRQVSPDCEEPGFLGGVGLLVMVALVTMVMAFVVLTYSSCVDSHTPKRRRLTVLTCVLAWLSGLFILLAIVTYGILTGREVSEMLSRIGEGQELSYLGWAFGADAMVSVLVSVAAVCLVIHLRYSPKASPEFQLVV